MIYSSVSPSLRLIFVSSFFFKSMYTQRICIQKYLYIQGDISSQDVFKVYIYMKEYIVQINRDFLINKETQTLSKANMITGYLMLIFVIYFYFLTRIKAFN